MPEGELKSADVQPSAIYIPGQPVMTNGRLSEYLAAKGTAIEGTHKRVEDALKKDKLPANATSLVDHKNEPTLADLGGLKAKLKGGNNGAQDVDVNIDFSEAQATLESIKLKLPEGSVFNYGGGLFGVISTVTLCEEDEEDPLEPEHALRKGDVVICYFVPSENDDGKIIYRNGALVMEKLVDRVQEFSKLYGSATIEERPAVKNPKDAVEIHSILAQRLRQAK